MNFGNFNPYGFMTLPQSNPIPMNQPQQMPQIQPPQMMQIQQMQNSDDLLKGMMQANQRGGVKDQLREKIGSAAGDFFGMQLGMPQLGAAINARILEGNRRQGQEMQGLLQAPQLSAPMSFSFDNAPQVSNGATQYMQTLRGLLA